MSRINELAPVRTALQKGKINLQGGGGGTKPTGTQIHFAERIEDLLPPTKDIETPDEIKIRDIIRDAISKIVKAVERFNSKHETETIQLTPEIVTILQAEIASILEVFKQNNVGLNVQQHSEHIKQVLVYQGPQYWENFFKMSQYDPQIHSPSIIRYFISHHPSVTKEKLLKLSDDFKSLCKDAKFSFFHPNPHIILHAVTHYKNPRQFLHDVQRNYKALSSKYPEINSSDILHICLHHPKNPTAKIKAVVSKSGKANGTNIREVLRGPKKSKSA